MKLRTRQTTQGEKPRPHAPLRPKKKEEKKFLTPNGRKTPGCAGRTTPTRRGTKRKRLGLVNRCHGHKVNLESARRNRKGPSANVQCRPTPGPGRGRKKSHLGRVRVRLPNLKKEGKPARPSKLPRGVGADKLRKREYPQEENLTKKATMGTAPSQTTVRGGQRKGSKKETRRRPCKRLKLLGGEKKNSLKLTSRRPPPQRSAVHSPLRKRSKGMSRLLVMLRTKKKSQGQKGGR